MTLCPYIAGKIIGKEVVPMETFQTLARISGFLFIFYVAFRIYDLITMTHLAPMTGRNYWDMWGGYYGVWMVVLELLLFVGPIVFLNIKKFRDQELEFPAESEQSLLANSVYCFTDFQRRTSPGEDLQPILPQSRNGA